LYTEEVQLEEWLDVDEEDPLLWAWWTNDEVNLHTV
jgi:hypothetical protein